MNFQDKIQEIREKDNRYKPDAYEFVMQALYFTQKRLNKEGHISGQQLLEGIREFGIDQYGFLVKTLFNYWGIKSTQDFGEIVFNMTDSGVMGKTEQDCRDDFKNVYDFDEAFDSKRITSNFSG